MTDFLNVSASLTGRRWVGPGIEQERAREAMAQATGLPNAVCATLARRGVTPDGAAAYLSPALRGLLPDPLSLRDMGTAAERFIEAFTKRQRIAVFGDYDVDGTTSVALMAEYLLTQKAQVTT